MTTYLTCADLVSRAGMTEDYWRRQCANKKLTAKKLGGEWRIHPDNFDAFMNAPGPSPVTQPERQAKRQSARQMRRSA